VHTEGATTTTTTTTVATVYIVATATITNGAAAIFTASAASAVQHGVCRGTLERNVERSPPTSITDCQHVTYLVWGGSRSPFQGFPIKIKQFPGTFSVAA
jgi:hypothetical protein